jgi:hypothetical protein
MHEDILVMIALWRIEPKQPPMHVVLERKRLPSHSHLDLPIKHQILRNNQAKDSSLAMIVLFHVCVAEF